MLTPSYGGSAGYWIGGLSSYLGTAAHSYIQYFTGNEDLDVAGNYGTPPHTGKHSKDLLPLNFNNIDTTTFVELPPPYINTLAHSAATGSVDLLIAYVVSWTGTLINNPSLGNQLTKTTNHVQSFTGGCKVGVAGQYTNLNTALQLHIPGSCIPLVSGCTDPASFNYNPLANFDDGSCVAFVYGCTVATALNYDPAANTDCDAAGTGSGNNDCCCLTPCPVPNPLSATQISGTFIELSYTDQPCAESYLIQTLEPGGVWTNFVFTTSSNPQGPGIYWMDISGFTSGIELQIRMRSNCVYTATGWNTSSVWTNITMYITP